MSEKYISILLKGLKATLDLLSINHREKIVYAAEKVSRFVFEKISRKKKFQFSGIGKMMAKQNSRLGTNRFPLKAFFPFCSLRFSLFHHNRVKMASLPGPCYCLYCRSLFFCSFFRVNWEQCMHRLSRSHVNPIIKTDLCPAFLFDPFAGRQASETN